MSDRILPPPPPEVRIRTDWVYLAPRFQTAVLTLLDRMRADGQPARIAESVRTEDRQRYLYGFGREYDDGRGIVTNAESALASWHGFGLAADIVHERLLWKAPSAFWVALREHALALRLTSGSDWNRDGICDAGFVDRPHVQWWCPGMRVSPSDHARALYAEHGLHAVWRELHADNTDLG